MKLVIKKVVTLEKSCSTLSPTSNMTKVSKETRVLHITSLITWIKTLKGTYDTLYRKNGALETENLETGETLENPIPTQ